MRIAWNLNGLLYLKKSCILRGCDLSIDLIHENCTCLRSPHSRHKARSRTWSPRFYWDPKSSLLDLKDPSFILTQNSIWRVLFAERLSGHSKNQFAKSLPHSLHPLSLFFSLSPILTPHHTMWSCSDCVQTRVYGENHILVWWQRWKLAWTLFPFAVRRLSGHGLSFWETFHTFLGTNTHTDSLWLED